MVAQIAEAIQEPKKEVVTASTSAPEVTDVKLEVQAASTAHISADEATMAAKAHKKKRKSKDSKHTEKVGSMG